MFQTKTSMWCRPRGPVPGGRGVGSLASRGSTLATDGSADLGTRGMQSCATGRTTTTNLPRRNANMPWRESRLIKNWPGTNTQRRRRRLLDGSRLRQNKWLALTKEPAAASLDKSRQDCTANVRPGIEYEAATWATAAKSNTSRFAKVQSNGMHAYHHRETKNHSQVCHGNCYQTPKPVSAPKKRSPSTARRSNDRLPTRSSNVFRSRQNQVEENQLQPSCQTSWNIPCQYLASHPWRDRTTC